MIHIKIDGKIMFRGDLDEWEHRPPDAVRDAIKPGVKPAPYMKALMITMADAIVAGTKELRINVVTDHRGWNMRVQTAVGWKP